MILGTSIYAETNDAMSKSQNFDSIFNDLSRLELKTERTILRSVCEDDLKSIFECRQSIKGALDPSICDVQNLEDVKKEFNVTKQFENMKIGLQFSIFKRDTGNYLGSINITSMWYQNNGFVKLNLGGDISQQYQNKGYMTEVLKYISDYLLATYSDVYRLEWGTLEGNISSEKCALSAGFEFEGTKRNDMFFNRHVWNFKVYSKIKNLF